MSSIKGHHRHSISCAIEICATDVLHAPSRVHREQSALGTGLMRASSEVQYRIPAFFTRFSLIRLLGLKSARAWYRYGPVI